MGSTYSEEKFFRKMTCSGHLIEKCPAVVQAFCGGGGCRFLCLLNSKFQKWYPKEQFFSGCLVKDPFCGEMIWSLPTETTILIRG